MLRTLQLLLPALAPSWRFFDVIAPAPRIEFRRLNTPDDVSAVWQEFRPRPARISLTDMLGRLFWNPRWNETLFLVTCAERLMEEPTSHSQDEIFRRIGAAHPAGEATLMQFRLVTVRRRDDIIDSDITFVSELRTVADAALP